MKESLQTEHIPDPMEGEQTWPTEEELAEAEEQSRAMKRRIKKVPKGMSEYQAAWIPDSDAGVIEFYLYEMELYTSFWCTVSQVMSLKISYSGRILLDECFHMQYHFMKV